MERKQQNRDFKGECMSSNNQINDRIRSLKDLITLQTAANTLLNDIKTNTTP